LEGKGVVEPEIARVLKVLAGYRNRMVHFYHEVTSKELYEICTSDLDDLQKSKEALLRWVLAHPEHMDDTL
jgi:uncharacterized protein YutE (UPF0331/DUF86 family)